MLSKFVASNKIILKLMVIVKRITQTRTLSERVYKVSNIISPNFLNLYFQFCNSSWELFKLFNNVLLTLAAHCHEAFFRVLDLLNFTLMFAKGITDPDVILQRLHAGLKAQ